MSKFENMGKEELRAACKAAAIKGWGKMNNTQMRAALNADYVEYPTESDAELDVAQNPDAPEHQADAPVEVVPPAALETPEVKALSALTPPAAPVVTAAPANTGKKIQKDRAEQNGVKRPSEGTICAHIWNELDVLRAATSATPSFKDLKALQDKHSWQRNTAVTQYQRWKEFNDLMVR